MERQDLSTSGWAEYELLDSGDGMKLERWGDIILARPETQALWKKLKPEKWNDAHALFEWHEGKGSWKFKKDVLDSWNLKWNDVSFKVRPTSFKHTGVFPEQAPNWEWILERLGTLEKPNVLNLFGYTGIASVVAAKHGAFVTHVDASKQSLDWAHENARLSGLSEDSIRYMFDDALAFAKREVRRGSKYQGIILDPPAFGRGAKGEVWKVEEQLQELIETTKELLAETPGSFYLLNGYAAGYTAASFAQLIESVFGPMNGGFGDMNIKESSSDRVISTGIYANFVR
jgi:23S rRNA (cytosine1962-C5)-methyltransferase